MVLREELLVAAEGVAIVDEETVGCSRDCTLSLCLAWALLPYVRDLECEEEEEVELSLRAALLPLLRPSRSSCNVTAFVGPTAGIVEGGSPCGEWVGWRTWSSLLGPCAPDKVVAASMASTGRGGKEGENRVVGSTDPRCCALAGGSTCLARSYARYCSWEVEIERR